MNKSERITEYWQSATPNKVGPGTYNIGQSSRKQQSAVPFTHSQKRVLTTELNRGNPGPGHYVEHRVSRALGVSFENSSVRRSPFERTSSVPGPGAYELETAKVPSRSPIHKSLFMPVKPSAASIPSAFTENKEVSPVTYSPAYHFVKPSPHASSFRKHKLIESKKQNIGPGYYDSFSNSPKKIPAHNSWFFNSKAKRIQYVQDKHALPGPGQYYQQSLDVKSQKRKLDAFGSATERDIPLSRDPHRPFASNKTQIPPIGYYFSKEKVEKIEKIRQKHFANKSVPSKPGFGCSEDRFIRKQTAVKRNKLFANFMLKKYR